MKYKKSIKIPIADYTMVEIGIDDADSWDECNSNLKLQLEEHSILMTEPVRRAIYKKGE